MPANLVNVYLIPSTTHHSIHGKQRAAATGTLCSPSLFIILHVSS